jgi:hypothetical protein
MKLLEDQVKAGDAVEIAGFSSYFVTKEGRVFHGDREISCSPDCRGYPQVTLCGRQDGRYVEKHAYVHRLVLCSFVGPRPVGMVCRHLNGNQKDNRLENLAWGTIAENNRDRVKHGTIPRAERHHKATISNEVAALIKRFFLRHSGYGSVDFISRWLGVSKSIASRIKVGKAWRVIA